MVTDESVKLENLRDIIYCSPDEYQSKKLEAIAQLTQGLTVPTDQIEIHFLDLEPPRFDAKRQIIVKVHKDRFTCNVGELGINHNEPDFLIRRMTKYFRTIEQRYQLFAIQHIGDPKGHSLYWVRMA